MNDWIKTYQGALGSVPSSADSMIPERKSSRLNDNLNDDSIIINDDTDGYNDYDEYINDITANLKN